MHSVSVSILGRVSHSRGGENSSTGFRFAVRGPSIRQARRGRAIWSDLGEVSLLPVGSQHLSLPPPAAASCDQGTERNESVCPGRTGHGIPNGKDRLKPRLGLLLNMPNTSEMRQFADEWHPINAAADEQVMDRSAEGAAGGYDAV